jgi:hypothetical protein
MGCGEKRVRNVVEAGPFPEDDGWRRLYAMFSRLAGSNDLFRRALCAYFWPKGFESWAGSRVYKAVGVGHFGRLIPTGGVLVRRITKARMAPYTLSGTSVGAAQAFYYRTCVFEFLHLPFFLALLGLSFYQLSVGRPDLAIEDSVVNMAVNVYPIMHHRHTRARIVRILSVRCQRTQKRLSTHSAA